MVYKNAVCLMTIKILSHFDKSFVVYKFNCFCDRSYISQTAGHLETKIKKYVTKRVQNFIKVK